MQRGIEIASRDFGQVYQRIQQLDSGLLVSQLAIASDPFIDVSSDVRPNSGTVEDYLTGDGGKGKVAQEMNFFLLRKLQKDQRIKEKTVYSLRTNGSDNAGHEVQVFVNGEWVEIATHQLPVAVTQEGAVGIMSKGMLCHVTNLVTEIDHVSDKLGGRLWGELWIDQNTVAVTDLHRSFEQFTNNLLGITGSTGSGIAQGYASFYEKRGITMRDFVSHDWENKFRQAYRFYAELVGGEEVLSKTSVKALTKEGGRRDKLVGTEEEHIDELRSARTKLLPYVMDVAPILEEIWKDPNKPITFEIGQGDGIDPYHGVYPDVTASRTIGRVNIPDATEGIVDYDDIAVTTGVLKIPYFTSVGSRVLPYSLPEEEAKMYEGENREWGR